MNRLIDNKLFSWLAAIASVIGLIVVSIFFVKAVDWLVGLL